MGLFKHSVFMCSINCLFLFICLLGDLTKLILPLSICVALWEFYYMYLFFQDMEDDFNRLVDFLIQLFGFLFKILSMFANVFKQFAMEAINSIQWNHNMELNCKYIYMI